VSKNFFDGYSQAGRQYGRWDHRSLPKRAWHALFLAGFLEANNDPAALLNMFNKDVQRMRTFSGWSDEQMRSIKAPTLVINGNLDVGSLEHAVEMCRMIPTCELAIFPGGHGNYLGAIESLSNGKWPEFNATSLIQEFLDNP
jgi:pimeloyl-ACP methyl ester carboxylesterase